MFTEGVLCVRHCAWGWQYSSEQVRHELCLKKLTFYYAVTDGRVFLKLDSLVFLLSPPFHLHSHSEYGTLRAKTALRYLKKVTLDSPAYRNLLFSPNICAEPANVWKEEKHALYERWATQACPWLATGSITEARRRWTPSRAPCCSFFLWACWDFCIVWKSLNQSSLCHVRSGQGNEGQERSKSTVVQLFKYKRPPPLCSLSWRILAVGWEICPKIVPFEVK